uniref:Uncharacterized protein n=1 Tax=Timema genevievae TaxID=629358 RepID=A0A7R9PLB7_TIMGE|nr:unnamed protein product [Timema genevievae]
MRLTVHCLCRYTLVQSYHVTRLVTAIKTLPPMELYHFVPSKTLNEFNTRLEEAGSELHLELEFGDDNDQDDDDRPAALRALQPDLDLANIGSEFDLSDVDRSRLPEDQHNRFKKAQNTYLNPGAAIPQVITTSRPILRVETVYESHVLPIVNGDSTTYSTLSRPVGTVSKTEYEYGTSTLPAQPVPQINQLFPQQQQQQQLFPQQQQQLILTSTPIVTQTLVTETSSKVLKLTFGAKTAYTTLFSTKVIPTLLTTYLTTSVPVQPTAPSFPGYFPAPYPQFPFVGIFQGQISIIQPEIYSHSWKDRNGHPLKELNPQMSSKTEELTPPSSSPAHLETSVTGLKLSGIWSVNRSLRGLFSVQKTRPGVSSDDPAVAERISLVN